MTSLFSFPETHDPGGKSRLRMLPGHRGGGCISCCGRYRHWLSREWGKDEPAPLIMFIGCNPSTADACSDDPTIRRELAIAQREGFRNYIKTNVFDYRTTNPRELLSQDVVPRSGYNLPNIKSFADRAAKIIVCWGNIHRKLEGFTQETIEMLNDYPLWCLGVNHSGSPKHPLYLPFDQSLELWR